MAIHISGRGINLIGLLLAAALLLGPLRMRANLVLDLNSFVVACFFVVVGVQLVTFGALARFYATITGMLPLRCLRRSGPS